MLEEVMRTCRNWFFTGDLYKAKWEIKDGVIDLPFLKIGQYFMIEGSVFNDGVHLYPESLMDEEFTGCISPMAVPQEFIRDVEKIQKWQDKYGMTAQNPFQSEKFDDYSYSKASGATSGGSIEWTSAFKSVLNKRRRI